MAGAIKAPARPGGALVVHARGKSRKRDAAMPLIKAIGCIGGGMAFGFMTERVFNPESTFAKAAVNGTASAAGGFGLSAAFDKNNKLRNTLVAGTGGVILGSRDKLSEWGDWLKSKISGTPGATTQKTAEKKPGTSGYTEEKNGSFATEKPAATYITYQAPKTEKKSTFETIFGGLTDVAGKVLPGLLEGALGSGGRMARAF